MSMYLHIDIRSSYTACWPCFFSELRNHYMAAIKKPIRENGLFALLLMDFRPGGLQTVSRNQVNAGDLCIQQCRFSSGNVGALQLLCEQNLIGL